jgi:outer membrane receptor protein involved in Fe transport
VACVDGPDLGFLCQGDAAAPLHDASGRRIADLTHGGAVAVGVNDREHIRSDGAGGSLQATSSARLWGRPNHLTVGGSLDAAWTRFASDGEVGPIDAALRVVSTGLFISTPEDTGFTAMPVALRARSTYAGLYVTDTLDVTDRASITASGRYDHARIDLTDRLGDNLNGRNRYQRFNPALGATWRLGRALTAYGGYAEGSRVPNPSEIECSNPLIPCLLPSSLASDPPTLRQVVAVTWEAGLRGRAPFAHGTLTWTAGWYRTEVHDDIQAVATSLSAGYFQNIGGTSREGVELGARYVGARLSAFVSYSHVEADYRTGFVLPSPSHPLRDAAGLIVVRPGDRLPGIPRDRLKLGVEIEPRAGWTLGVNFNLVGDQAYRGDESNQLAPLPAYAVVNLHTSLNLTRNFSLFATVDNVLDAHYATFGLLGDPTGVGAPGVPDSAADPRFQSPAAPISAYGGVRVQF